MGEEAIERLARMIRAAGEGGTAVLTGAGISTASGIPGFRSPGTGHWIRVNPMEVAHIDVFRRDPERFWSFYRHRLDIPDQFEPNAGHRALARPERAGYIRGIATQNIDGLHQRAGSREVIELHGSVRKLVCVRCAHEVSREEALGSSATACRSARAAG